MVLLGQVACEAIGDDQISLSVGRRSASVVTCMYLGRYYTLRSWLLVTQPGRREHANRMATDVQNPQISSQQRAT